MSIETILLALDTEDEARAERLAEETIDVAGPTGAAVVLVHVFTDAEFDDVREKLDVDPRSEEATPDAVAKRHTTTRTISKALSAADVDHTIRGAVGDHADEIVAIAADVDADRVIVGGRNRSPTGKAVFGSVAQEVILTAPCPVTFVRNGSK
ncbi:universal stress protein [Halorubrum sp. DTA98]|uniref:universal stress protein n=1 Tax=Halorubrum sp. DTA98 TaxID=3402163 RepID=UPI003AAB7CD3